MKIETHINSANETYDQLHTRLRITDEFRDIVGYKGCYSSTLRKNISIECFERKIRNRLFNENK